MDHSARVIVITLQRCVSRNKADGDDATSGWHKAAKGALYSRKSTYKRRVTQELQECIARCHLPSVSGRLVARAKNIGMNIRGTSGTLDPVPYALQR